MRCSQKNSRPLLIHGAPYFLLFQRYVSVYSLDLKYHVGRGKYLPWEYLERKNPFLEIFKADSGEKGYI